jgi:hypothetical protein
MEEQRHNNSTKRWKTVVKATKSYINNKDKKAVLKSAYRASNR